jgi:hypothetical protein
MKEDTVKDTKSEKNERNKQINKERVSEKG